MHTLELWFACSVWGPAHSAHPQCAAHTIVWPHKSNTLFPTGCPTIDPLTFQNFQSKHQLESSKRFTHTNTHTQKNKTLRYNTLKRTTPVMVLAAKWCIDRRAPPPSTLGSVLLVVAGCLVAGAGDLAFDPHGYTLAILCAVLQVWGSCGIMP